MLVEQGRIIDFVLRQFKSHVMLEFIAVEFFVALFDCDGVDFGIGLCADDCESDCFAFLFSADISLQGGNRFLCTQLGSEGEVVVCCFLGIKQTVDEHCQNIFDGVLCDVIHDIFLDRLAAVFHVIVLSVFLEEIIGHAVDDILHVHDVAVKNEGAVFFIAVECGHGNFVFIRKTFIEFVGQFLDAFFCVRFCHAAVRTAGSHRQNQDKRKQEHKNLDQFLHFLSSEFFSFPKQSGAGRIFGTGIILRYS